MNNLDNELLAKVRDVFSYDSKLGVLIWKKSKGAVKSGVKAGTLHQKGYIAIILDGKRYLSHRLIWLYVYGELPDCEIDHINKIKNDNRIENLRLATKYENLKNTTIRKDNSTGFKGVHFSNCYKKYRAEATLNNKRHYLGSFMTAADASEAYNSFCKLHHGDFYFDTRNSNAPEKGCL
jgi:hypothetical protein